MNEDLGQEFDPISGLPVHLRSDEQNGFIPIDGTVTPMPLEVRVKFDSQPS